VIFFALLGVGVIAAVLVAAAMSLFLRRPGAADHARPGSVPSDEIVGDAGTERVVRVSADRTGEHDDLPEGPPETPPT